MTMSLRTHRSNVVRNLAVRRTAVSVALLGAFALAAACKPAPPAPACPASYKDLPADQKSASTITCSCKGNETGAVWGAKIYTTDSNICAAALHAGATTTTGGNVTVYKAGGCTSYTGTVANGITTAAWDAFDSSFYFFGSGDGKCPGAAGSASASASARPAMSAPPRSSASPSGSASGAGSANGAPRMKN